MGIILSQLRWASLAQDLAVMTVPGSPLTELGTVYQTYGITPDDLKEIIKVPHFQDLFKHALEQFQSQGNRAGAIYRTSTLAQALAEKLFRDATIDGSRMENKDAIKLLELLLRSGGLLDTKGDTTVNVQTNVGVSLPLPQGLTNPKLNHLGSVKEALDV